VVISRNPAEFNCPRCSPAKQIENGCEQDSPIPKRWEIAGQSYQRCPLRLVTAKTWLAIRLYQQYERGFLPVSGGILEQSAAFLQAVEIIQAALRES